MRLFRCGEQGPALTQDFPAEDVPPYAILSHTWDVPADEVTYEDMVDGSGPEKAGYGKIRFCADRAAQDGLEYFWVDACCINSADSNEVNRSINSMFRWYRDAKKCYVYLSDVSTGDDDAGQVDVRAVRGSRWFTRAWTLQELLAPASVEFFSQQGRRLGDKRTLEQTIYEATNIPLAALRGEATLLDFSIEDRLGWAAKRQATLEEDTAYCLLGIFGVFLPLIYGEGRASAEARLKTAIVGARNAEDVLGHLQKSHTWLVPYERNDAFTGREPELQRLYQSLVSGRRRDQTARMALAGLGGMGKTQVALEFLFRVRVEHEHILWMPASSHDALSRAYEDAAAKLGLMKSGGPAEQSPETLVHAYLSRADTGPWVLVFDNVDDEVAWFQHPCSQSLPKSSRGSMLFTTRSKKVAVKLAGRDVLAMDAMDVDDSRQLLARQLVDPGLVDDAAEGQTAALLARLARLPLAIVQAAMYVNANSIALEDYAALLDEQEADVVDLLSAGFEEEGMHSGANTARHPVAQTWLISFQQIRQRDPRAADYLSFMACVDARDIPPGLLPPPPSRKAHIEALGLLKGYSFVSQASSGASLHVHRLVHLATRNWLRLGRVLDAFAEQVTETLAEKLLRVTLADRPVWRAYMPHAAFVLRQAWPGEAAPTTMAQLWSLFLVSRCGHCLQLEGRYAEAERCLARARRSWTAWKGVDHFQTRDAMNNLALACEYQGRLDEAVALYLEALGPRRDSALEKDDFLTSAIWGNLACVYGKQGRLEEAVAEAARLTTAMENVYGAEHPQTLLSMNNLAGLHYDKGEWPEAIAIHRRVLDTRRRVLGLAQADTIISMNNLATALRENGEAEAAEALYGEAVEVLARDRCSNQKLPQEKTSSPGWISTATITGMDRQTSPKAMELREALNKTMLGDEHPLTLASMHSLALTWKGGPRDAEARDKMRLCYEMRQRILGGQHVDTLASETAWREWWDQETHQVQEDASGSYS